MQRREIKLTDFGFAQRAFAHTQRQTTTLQRRIHNLQSKIFGFVVEALRAHHAPIVRELFRVQRRGVVCVARLTHNSADVSALRVLDYQGAFVVCARVVCARVCTQGFAVVIVSSRGRNCCTRRFLALSVARKFAVEIGAQPHGTTFTSHRFHHAFQRGGHDLIAVQRVRQTRAHCVQIQQLARTRSDFAAQLRHVVLQTSRGQLFAAVEKQVTHADRDKQYYQPPRMQSRRGTAR